MATIAPGFRDIVESAIMLNDRRPPFVEEWANWLTILIVLAAFLLAYRLYITWRPF